MSSRAAAVRDMKHLRVSAEAFMAKKILCYCSKPTSKVSLRVLRLQKLRDLAHGREGKYDHVMLWSRISGHLFLYSMLRELEQLFV